MEKFVCSICACCLASEVSSVQMDKLVLEAIVLLDAGIIKNALWKKLALIMNALIHALMRKEFADLIQIADRFHIHHNAFAQLDFHQAPLKDVSETQQFAQLPQNARTHKFASEDFAQFPVMRAPGVRKENNAKIIFVSKFVTQTQIVNRMKYALMAHVLLDVDRIWIVGPPNHVFQINVDAETDSRQGQLDAVTLTSVVKSCRVILLLLALIFQAHTNVFVKMESLLIRIRQIFSVQEYKNAQLIQTVHQL